MSFLRPGLDVRRTGHIRTIALPLVTRATFHTESLSASAVKVADHAALLRDGDDDARLHVGPVAVVDGPRETPMATAA